MSWLFIGLLAAAVLVVVGAEWPRLSERAGIQSRQARARARRKDQLTLIKTETETDEFEASVRRDLDRLPTIEEHDPRR